MNRSKFFSSALAILGGPILLLAGACSLHIGIVEFPSVQAKPLVQVSDGLAQRLMSHIEILAHDQLRGRGTGSKGIDLAAGYIAGQFAAAGLLPGGPEGTYFQDFDVDGPSTILDDTQLNVKGDGLTAELKSDFVPFGFSSKGDFEGDVVFVGYGITHPDQQHDDYADMDVQGKVVMMLRREPNSWHPEGDYDDHARFDTKIKLAKEKGAVAVLIVNQDPGEDGVDGLMRFRGGGQSFGLPAMHLKRKFADKLLTQGSLSSLVALQARLEKNSAFVSAPLQGVQLAGNVAFEKKDILARNVIGILPGTGSKADEYIVIGAHYDHLGERNGEIYNGADDNASGTAGVIELAWELADLPHRERSVLFMTYSGEEMGLLGSKHYAADPTVDIEQITTMINMDMIGRLTPDDEANMLAIQGLGTGNSFESLVATQAQRAGMDYLPDPSALGPSDHASFYRAGVPSLFFFTGVHADYHQPGDDIEKINSIGAAEIVRLVGDIAEELINAEEAPQYAEVTQRAEIMRGSISPRGGRRPGGVVMGIMPSRDDQTDAAGWLISRVVPGGGADDAGMQDGDRILSLDGKSITNFRDYLQVIRDKKPDDTVEVLIKRGDKRMTLTVKLAARG